MKDIKEIEKAIPYKKYIFGNTYGTDMVVGTKRGSIVFSNNEGGYEHVSFSPYSRKMPSWEDMCALKDIFWNDDEEVYQIHPPKNEYVDLQDNCLHLWKPKNGKRLNDLLEVDSMTAKETLIKLWKKVISMHDDYVELEELDNYINEILSEIKQNFQGEE